VFVFAGEGAAFVVEEVGAGVVGAAQGLDAGAGGALTEAAGGGVWV